MSFFKSLFRFVGTMFGLGAGATERATDKLLTASPEAIKSQFRNSRESLARNYAEIRDAVAQLLVIRESKSREIQSLQASSLKLDAMMRGSIAEYQKNQDERLRIAYANLAEDKEKTDQRVEVLEREVADQDKMIESYKLRLVDLQHSIEDLKKEEAETVADIISSRAINDLNDKLSGLSLDTQAKNLEAIREARNKARSVARLSTELSGADKKEFEAKVVAAGRAAKHAAAFDEAVGVKQEPHLSLNAANSRVKEETFAKSYKEG